MKVAVVGVRREGIDSGDIQISAASNTGELNAEPALGDKEKPKAWKVIGKTSKEILRKFYDR
jgi:hypothetical protein